ncbi:hypothetical protein [Lamprocystis purpurea]|jgi:hypothetical protein|uniref:hypothetical protein n=1 Tax=Lamprocystis purpurea TaxID=61598 RepID=UPI000366ABD3|nr:hypothetical protein [Lamprocystis purpurea]
MFNHRSSRDPQPASGSTRRDPARGKEPAPWLLIPRRPAANRGRGGASSSSPLRQEPDDV